MLTDANECDVTGKASLHVWRFVETSATPHSEAEQLKSLLICLHIDILEADLDFYKNSQH